MQIHANMNANVNALAAEYQRNVKIGKLTTNTFF